MAAVTGAGDVIESGPGVPRGCSRLLIALGTLVLLAAGGVWFRGWAAERELRHVVELTVTFGLVSSSTSPPGGSVLYFLGVRNDGPRPLSVTSVDASSGGLRIRMRDAGRRRIDVGGEEVDIPLSVRVTCSGGIDVDRRSLPASIGVRREDGGTTTRRVALGPAAVVLDVAATLCDVQPGLRAHELSGPVLRRG
jgi:hypothetical protein